MTRVVCFADEAGLYKPCSTLCVAVLCFEVKDSAEKAGLEVIRFLRLLLGVRGRGELKYRVVARAASRQNLDVSQVASVIEERSLAAACKCRHLESVNELQAVKESLLREAMTRISVEATTLFVDEGLLASSDAVLGRVRRAIGIRAVKLGSSEKLAGIQLADIYAGYCREHLTAGH